MSRRLARNDSLLPDCGWTFDGRACRQRGDHLCRPRVAHARAFFAEVLVHTKGKWARRPFILAGWQAAKVIGPVFGRVGFVPDDTGGAYRRTTRVVWIELARKNGKSELLAGIALYMLVADGEESAEVYGAALDRDQAGKVWQVAERMVALSPVLSARLKINRHSHRIIDEKTGSYYEIVAADAAGNLGHNPHCVVFDEVAVQRNGDLWDAFRTSLGTRDQALIVAATTPGTDPQSWCGGMHNEMRRVADDPARAPHVHVFMRNTPTDADPFGEPGWSHANPALGDFLSIRALRDEAVEARNDPAKENVFRVYRLAQWTQQATRWMPMHLYDACTGEPWLDPDWRRDDLRGAKAWFGLDLAARFDLTAWALLIPSGDVVHALFRFWLPEAAVDGLDKLNDGAFGRWARAGWLTLTDGDVLDYEQVYADIEADSRHFRLMAGDADQFSAAPVVQEIEKRTRITEITTCTNTYRWMTPGLNDVMALVRAGALVHHGNPVARFCFDSVEVEASRVDPDQVKPVKPDRRKAGKRIDAVPALAMAANAWKRARPQTQMYAPTRIY